MAWRRNAPQGPVTASAAQAVHAEVQPSNCPTPLREAPDSPLRGSAPHRDAPLSRLNPFHFSEFVAGGRIGRAPSNRAIRGRREGLLLGTSPQGQ